MEHTGWSLHTYFRVDHFRCLWLFTLFVERLFTHYFCGAEELLLTSLTMHLQSAQQKMDPRSDSGRESVSSQWWEGVDKKKFVLLSLGGRRQRKADNSDSSVLLYFVWARHFIQSAGVTGHLHLQTCISEPCHCDTYWWCVTPCCLVVVAITTVLAFGENLTL